MNGYIIFSDLKGFSKLSEPEMRQFYNVLLPRLSEIISPYIKKAEVFNTWGDAIVAVYDNGTDAVELALAYRDFFKTFDFADVHIDRNLQPRIAGHFGEFFIFTDPLLGRKNVLGTNINTTARIEPVTRPGEIFVTKQFKDMIEGLPHKLTSVRFNELGEISLAKNFGVREVYRLFRATEKQQIVDKILIQDFSWALPEPSHINSDESRILEFYAKSPSNSELRKMLTGQTIEGKTGSFIVELADICRKFGLYTEALQYIEKAEVYHILVDGMMVFPYKFNVRLLKMKANCFTRLGEYERAADIVYSLWKFGDQDIDTLCMIAAQYKRKALFNNNNKIVDKANINMELLERSINLYLEAFRRDIDNFYPAINVAYLYKIMNGMTGGKGTKMAQYILDVWGDREGEEWWLDSTLAEAEILYDDMVEAEDKFIKALDKHNPDVFMRSSVSEQIKIYAAITNRLENVKRIINLLESEGKLPE